MGEKKVVVRIDDELHHKARVESVKRGVPIAVIVRDALRAFVEDKPKRKPKGESMNESKK